MLQVALLPARVELIRHLNLPNILRKKAPKRIPGLAILERLHVAPHYFDIPR